MGEVYKARDTRLERLVAIKVLPQHLSSSPEVRLRFEREAKTISQLSHPNICSLYDVNREGETEYLVMEYLEGETLARRLAGGPLPLEQALRLAIQIGEALGVAHGKGIVHRDLKPDNVMVTKSGPKLLDFGLAKPSALGPTSELTSSPTIAATSANVTREGTILGTLLYMAPEQLEGREADSRTDIFAFGAVLYEMVTGRKAFSGSSQASVISAIMREQPEPIVALQPFAPPALEQVVRTCLAKDPEERWQSARDVVKQLRWIEEGGSRAEIAPSPAPGRRRREWAAWALAAAGVAAAATVSFLSLSRRPAAASSSVKTSILHADKSYFATPEGSFMALSPDGTRLTFSASSPDDPAKFLLWMRPLNNASPKPLPGTEGAFYPFWSPDGSAIGFMVDKRLKKLDLGSGAVQTLCDLSSRKAVADWVSKGGTWNREGVILFAPDPRDGLYRISASGGTPTLLTEPDRSIGEFSHRFPSFLPDGRHFLYLALATPKEGESEPHGIYVGTLDSKERRLIQRTDSVNTPLFTPYGGGFLLFENNRGLVAQRFDPKTFALSGEPAVLRRGTLLSASATGSLAFLESSTSRSQLIWLDQDGRKVGSLGKPNAYWDARLSHDGRRIAAVLPDDQTGNMDIWIIDISRDVTTRFTFGPEPNGNPVWSPDDTRIAYAQQHGARTDIRARNASGAGNEEVLFSQGTDYLVPGDWSPDGRFLCVLTYGKGLMTLSVAERKAVPVAAAGAFSSFSANALSYSPDGRFVVYSANETGRSEVYVRSIAGDGKWQVSTAGGYLPFWSHDGKQIVYQTADGAVMSVIVRTDPKVELAAPRPLFAGKDIDRLFGLSPDGKRFLAAESSRDNRESTITLVQNWTAELRK